MTIALLIIFPLSVRADEGITAEEQQQIVSTNDVYPIDVEETEENGFYMIVRTYALSSNEEPKNIPRNNFTKYGEKYIFSEITKKENSTQNRIQHIETVTINTPKNTMESVLSQLESEINYEKDGFQGILKLDISSIKTEAAGYKTKTSNLSTTREYPNLSNNDTSSIPKSISQNGLTYNLTDVRFVGDSTVMIDYEQIPETYKAIATYNTTSKSTNVTGYTTTANYVGEITKTLVDKTIYKVYFLSENPINKIVEEPEIINTLDNDNLENENSSNNETDNASNFNIKPIIMVLLIIVGVIGGIIGASIAIWYLSNQNSIIIFNYDKNKSYYKKIGRVRLNLKKDKLIVDLNKFSKKIQSSSFVIELSKQLCKKLLKRPEEYIELIIRYNDEEYTKKISTKDEIEEQFEINFSEAEEIDDTESISDEIYEDEIYESDE